MLLHFLLLHRVADQDGAGREAGLTGSVLRMEVRGGEEELRVLGASFAATRAAVAPFFGPKPVSTTSVAWLPTTMAMLGKPMIAQTWSEILVVFSLTIGWFICANALVAASEASAISFESDFMVSLLHSRGSIWG